MKKILLIAIPFIIISVFGLLSINTSAAQNSITWWGVMSYEVELNGKIFQMDPFFRIHRKGHYITCSDQFSDHSSVSTKERILKVSKKDLKVIIEPPNCPTSDNLKKITKHLKKQEVYEDENFWVKGYYGFEYTKLDLIYLIKSKKTNLTFLHSGDANDPAYSGFVNAFEEFHPKRVDYYFCALGKVEIDNIKKLVLKYKPRFLIPGHHPYMIVDIKDESSLVQFPEEGVPYLRPKYSVDHFVKEMKSWIKKHKLDTKIIVLAPGEKYTIPK